MLSCVNTCCLLIFVNKRDAILSRIMLSCANACCFVIVICSVVNDMFFTAKAIDHEGVAHELGEHFRGHCNDGVVKAIL